VHTHTHAQLYIVEGIDFVGSLHVWTLSPGVAVASIHVDCTRERSFDAIITELRQLLKRYGVTRITVQPHFVESSLKTQTDQAHLLIAKPSEYCCTVDHV
jgi:Co/Zn/Cd efflux system component